MTASTAGGLADDYLRCPALVGHQGQPKSLTTACASDALAALNGVEWEGQTVTLTWVVIIAGAALFGFYLLGRMTPESRAHQPIIDTATVPEWAKILALIVVICAAIIWFAG
jgi:hypothetical protein